MSPSEIGRNDPCPCGSGRKYKACCLGRTRAGPEPSPGLAEATAELKELLRGRTFASLSEAQAFLDREMLKRNRAPREDFFGLSPEQMHRLLEAPFASPEVATFAAVLSVEPRAPILDLFTLLVEGIGQGVKTTVKGNLPRALCREAALAYWGEAEYRRHTEFGGVNKEEDFFDLHVTRLVAELAGFVRKSRGKFVVSRKCRDVLAGQGTRAIWTELLRVYTEKFNWGYRDRHPDLPIVQQSFLFSLYLLSRFGEEWRPTAFYEDAFLRAFPAALRDLPQDPLYTPEMSVRACYRHRVLEGFAGFLGLAAVEPTTQDRYPVAFRVRKLPLLEETVAFRV
ncbi:MAG: SEC-C domain-containing protein [Deltaproteobacteria bacterium]|nr:SEC-C domain-containing protein [Deltaproteobacteria bacterium]